MLCTVKAVEQPDGGVEVVVSGEMLILGMVIDMIDPFYRTLRC